MADYSPVKALGASPGTFKVGATAVVGGRFVMYGATGLVIPGTAAANVGIFGVAAHSAASGEAVTVWPITNCVHLISCPAGATVGDVVVGGDAGIAVKATGAGIAAAAAAGTLRGIVLETVAADAASLVKFIGR